VHILGDRPEARLLALAFDVAVLTSLSEGLSNSVMEAMSAGVPVVATAVGGTLELIVDNETGFLVPPADVESLTNRITFALRNEAVSSVVARRGREFMTSRFSMQQMVKSVEKLYDEIMEDRL
jgi:glycosyltransferase involved in cell wall biosynthesis